MSFPAETEVPSTEELLAEALRQSEERYRFVVGGLPQLIWVSTADGAVYDPNSYLTEYTGLSVTEFEDSGLLKVIDPGDLLLYSDEQCKAFESTEPHESQIRIRRASDGRYRRHLFRSRPFSAASAARRLNTAHDIEEGEGSTIDDRLRIALRTAQAGVWDWNVENGRAFYSPELYELYGLDPATTEPSYEQWLQTVHPDDRARVAAETEHALTSGEELRHEFRALRGGDVRWMTAVGRTIHARGEPCRMIGLTIDTTELRLAEEATRQKATADSIGRLAGGVAHDFNNLLAGILGGASFLQELIPQGHAGRPILDVIRRSGERASVLTKRLLAYSGKSITTRFDLDVSKAVREACLLARTKVPPNVDFETQTDRDLPSIRADADQLRDLVGSLVENAFEAIGDRPGKIRVRTGLESVNREFSAERFPDAPLEPGTYVFIEVEDNGEGMSREVLRRMYEPFFTTRFTGRGLGLSAAQGIVKAHSGAIEVKSRLGEGSVFRVLLPVDNQPAEPAEKSPKAESSGAIVLVVDDEEAVRYIVDAALVRAGFKVLSASDGTAGVEAFRQRADQIALVLLDVSMPGLSGAEVFRQLRAIRPDISILITSGYSGDEALSHFPANETAGFVQKPFTVRQLATAVQQAVAKKAP